MIAAVNLSAQQHLFLPFSDILQFQTEKKMIYHFFYLKKSHVTFLISLC